MLKLLSLSQTEWLEHLDKVTLECAEKVKMESGSE